LTEETSVKNSPSPSGIYNLSRDEMGLDELDEILSSTIKHDSPTKKILFLGMLMNYTEEDQQNFAFNAPSSTGKTFIALEVAEYLPPEDLMLLAYSSPTAFFHSQGVLVDENLSPLQDRRDYVEEWIEKWEEENPEPKKGEGKTTWKEKRRDEVRALKSEWDQKTKFYMVDLEKKIIIFLDQPHDELLKKLRPMLSHDKKFLPVKITDKTKEGGHKTKDILVVGYPTMIFLSVNTSLEGQERTRTFLLSPEISQPKLEDSILQSAEKLSDRDAFKKKLEDNKNRIKLLGRIQSIKDARPGQIIITPEDRDYITARFLKEHNHLEPRHQRDFPRLIALIKGHALLNMYNRERMPTKIWANRHDCDEGYKLYNEVSEANEQGLPPHYYKFLVDSLKPQLTEDGLTRKEVSYLYREYFRTRIGDKRLKKMIETLAEAGLVYEDKDPNDKRFIKIYTLEGGGENFIEPTLQERLNLIFEALQNTCKYEADGPTHRDRLYDVLSENRAHKWDRDTFERVLKIAMRDGKIFSPRPDHLMFAEYSSQARESQRLGGNLDD